MRLAAAGSINRAFIINMPIHFIDSMTITASKMLKESSMILDFTFLLLARDTFTPTELSLLKKRNQYIREITKIIHSKPISLVVMLRMSPKSNPEYLEKLPPLESISRPIDILNEENTDITVSVDRVLLRFI